MEDPKSAMSLLGNLEKYYELLQNCLFSEFAAFVSAIKNLNHIDYKTLEPEDRDTLMGLRQRYGTLLKDITAVCNRSIVQLNRMKHAKTKDNLQTLLNDFNWPEYSALVSATQTLQVDVGVFKHACEKYKEAEFFWLNLFTTLGAVSLAIAAGLACLAAAPVVVTVALGLTCAAAAVTSITMATLTVKDYQKRQEAAEIAHLQDTLGRVEKHLLAITVQENKIVDMEGDYDPEELRSMKETVQKLQKEIVALRNLATKEITF